MFRPTVPYHSGYLLALCAAMLLGLAAAPVRAVPLAPEADTQPELDALLETDPLGYTCIPEESLEVAFHATGKGIHLPRTCLPKPCEAALSRGELADLMGAPPTDALWDDYYARYAQICRHEAVWPPRDSGGAVAGPGAVRDFWRPILTRGRAIASLGGRPGGGGSSISRPGGGGPVIIGGGGGSHPGENKETSSTGGGPDTPGETPTPPDETPTPPKEKPTPPEDQSDEAPPVSVVPLPAPAGLLASVLAALAVLGRRRRRARA